MATADLITSFLSNEMSPERERQFLLSVAASDSMRLELKSHMLLDRILLGQAQRSRVPDAIRASILAAAGVGTAAATSPAADAKPAAPAAPRGRFFNRLGGRAAIVIAAAACFGAGYYAGLEPADRTAASPRVERPAAPTASPSIAAPAPQSGDDRRANTEPVVTDRVEPRTQRATPATRTTTPTLATRPSARATEPAAAEPARSDLPRDPAPRLHPRRSTLPNAGVETTIKKSTEEERNATPSSPAEPQK